MLNTMTLTLSMIMSMTFPFLKHPVSMSLMLIMQTIMIALITGLMIKTFWFSYILMITMLSGVLVLFMYMASIASNEKFKTSIKMTLMIMLSLMMSMVFFFFSDQLGMESMWSSSKKNMVVNEQTMNLIKLFNMHNMALTLTIISYLFITMISVSFIVEVQEGPLRIKTYE